MLIPMAMACRIRTNSWQAPIQQVPTAFEDKLEPSSQGLFLNWNTEPGLIYQIQTSTDLKNWTELGTPRFASGAIDSIYVAVQTLIITECSECVKSITYAAISEKVCVGRVAGGHGSRSIGLFHAWPFDDWQIDTLSYQTAFVGAFVSGPPAGTGQDIPLGGPMNLGEEYRWNMPTLYYAVDQSFLDYFGSNGWQRLIKPWRS
jgi:hypothetical protein